MIELVVAALLFSAQSPESSRHLEELASTIEELPLPRALAGPYRDGPVMTRRSKYVEFTGIRLARTKEVFGTRLADGWVHQAWRRRFGTVENPGAKETIVISYHPSRKHAYFSAMCQMIDGVQSTLWPRIGFPELTGKETRLLGDRVWGFRKPTEYSTVALVGNAVLRIELYAPKQGKKPRTPYSAQVIRDWEAHVAKVVERVRASPLYK